MNTTKTTTVSVTVRPGEDIPRPGADLMTVSMMTGIRYAIHVTSIARLEWGEGGELHVTVRGHKRAYHPESPVEVMAE